MMHMQYTSFMQSSFFLPKITNRVLVYQLGVDPGVGGGGGGDGGDHDFKFEI